MGPPDASFDQLSDKFGQYSVEWHRFVVEKSSPGTSYSVKQLKID